MPSKKLLRSSLIYVVLGFLPMAVNFLLAPFYSHWLTPVQNALIAQGAIYQTFLTIFVSLSIDSAFSRYYFEFYKKPKMLQAYLSTLVTFILLVSVILLLILIPFGNRIFNFIQRNDEFNFDNYGIWIFITASFTVIQSLLLAYERNKERAASFAAISLSYFFLSLIFAISGILILKMEALGIIAGRAIAYTLVTVTLLFFFYRKHRFFFKLSFLKKSLAYSLPLVPYLILMGLYGNIDRIMIEKRFDSPQVLGIYTFAFMLSGAVSVFISSAQNVQIPVIYRLLSQPSRENDRKINEIVKTSHFVIVSAIVVGLAVAAIFIKLTFAKEYQVIVDYLGILFFAYIFRTYYILFTDSLFFFHKTKLIFLISLASFLIGYACMNWFIPVWGIPGVCLSVMIINFSQCAGAMILLKLNKLNTNFYKMNMNHFYSFLILLSYFCSRYLFIEAGFPVIYCNFIPCLVTLFFSIYYFYKRKIFFREKYNVLKGKYKWLSRFAFFTML